MKRNDNRNRNRLAREGHRLLEKGRYADAAIVLEQAVKSSPKDPRALILLAAAYLYASRFANAGSCLDRVRSIDPGYMTLLEIEGFMALKGARGRDAALAVYLDLIDRCPADRMLQRARRRIMDTSDFAGLQKNARLADFVDLPAPPRFGGTDPEPARAGGLRRRGPLSGYTRRGRRAIARRALIAAGILACAAAAAFVAYLVAGPRAVRQSADRETAERVSLTGLEHELGKKTAPGSVAVLYKTPHELDDDFNRARGLLKNGDHNGSLYFLNRVLNSNANFMAKEKARFLVKYITDSEERVFIAIPIERIRGETYLYRGFAVRLNGSIASLRKRERGAQFVLKTGSTSPEEVDVFLPGGASGVREGGPVAVEGVIADFTGPGRRVYLVARSVTPL